VRGYGMMVPKGAIVPYRFEAGESITEAVRRISGEQIDTAVKSLNGKTADRDEAVHEARKCIKKLRALLRLTKDELGDAFDKENARLRELGRNLSPYRDAAAMVQTFDELAEKYGAELDAHTAGSIRGGLLAHKNRGERRQSLKLVLQTAAKELIAAKRRIRRLPVKATGFAAIGPGIERAFREGRDAMRKAHKQPTAENLHAWRKRAKDHWYHVRLLNDLWPDVMGGYEAALKSLEDDLGTNHNLDILMQRIKAEPDFFATPEQVDACLQAISHFQGKLQRKAHHSGRRVYAEKPAALLGRLGAYWSIWT
jgi:CHAD domain-containing protein